jgi:tetratricopeptide (TPR) repeat protein
LKDARVNSWLWALPVILAALVYAPAPWGDLVWDDYFIELQLPAFDSPRDLLFPPAGIRGWTYLYYRPLVVLSYMLDALIFGSGSSVGPHLSNVIYHVATTWLIWLLASRLFAHFSNGYIAACVAAVLFAVHPIHTESVYWIAGRSDVLATMFVLASGFFALRWRDGDAAWTVGLAGLFYFAALMAKETAVAALLLVPMVVVAAANSTSTARATGKRFMWVVMSTIYMVVTVLYLALRGIAVETSGVGLFELPWRESVTALIQAGAYYLAKVVIPWPQSNIVVRDMLPGPFISVVILLCGAAMIAIGVAQWRRKRNGLVLIAIAWFAVTIAPSVVIAVSGDPIGRFPVAERYLYMPSVGFALLLGVAFNEVAHSRWRNLSIFLSVLLVAAYASATLNRGFTWQSNLRLWTDTTSKVRTHGAPWNELGRSYRAINDDDNALKAFLRALELDNTAADRAAMTHNIGTIYLRRENLEQAEKYYRLALDERPNLPEPNYGMGLVYTMRAGAIFNRGGTVESLSSNVANATRYFAAATQNNPEFHLARILTARLQTDYGRVLERQGDTKGALAAYRLARSQIAATLERIPPSALPAVERQWRAQVNIDLEELQKTLNAGLGRLTQ